MVVAEFSIVPITDGSLRDYIKAAIEEVRRSGLQFEVGAMGTTVEGELDEVLDVVKQAHRAVRAAGAARVVTSIKIDERSGPLSIEGKLEGLR
jgi:uncharacterized protein (TIGR00106 family)